MSIVFEFPDAADLANDTLATKPHSTLHGDIGDTLEAYIAALGKVDPSGFENLPTLFDPASTDWDDGSWETIERVSSEQANWYFGVGDDGLVTDSLIIQHTALNNAVQRILDAESDSGNQYGDISFAVGALRDGSSRSALFRVDTDLTRWEVSSSDTALTQTIKAVAAQTDPLLDLQDSTGQSRVSAFADSTGIQFHDDADLALGGLQEITSFGDTYLRLTGGDLAIQVDAGGGAFFFIDDSGGVSLSTPTSANSISFTDSVGMVILAESLGIFGAAGLATAARPAVPTQVAVVSVSDFNAIRTAMIALGIWTDGD